jgi:arylsulfatase A-like enzyme
MKEQRGDYLAGTVQVIHHIINEIKESTLSVLTGCIIKMSLRAFVLAALLTFLAACSSDNADDMEVFVPGDILRLTEIMDKGMLESSFKETQSSLFKEEKEFDGMIGTKRIFVGKTLQDAIYVRAPGSYRIRIRPGMNHSLRFGAAVLEGGPSLSFGISVEHAGVKKIVEELTVDAAEDWIEQTVDLSPWADQTITLVFFNNTEGEKSMALWGNPRILRTQTKDFNVILYLIDALRADHLGAYGYNRPTSPVIDGLADDGVLFEYCYAQDTRTLGSIPSLLTSLYPPSHGIYEHGKKIGPELTTFPEVLQSEGFQTASFITNVNAGPLADLDRGFDILYDAIKRKKDRDAPRTFPTESFFDWLDQNGDTRFFAYIHTAEPHRPYNPPPPFDTLFDQGYRGEITGYLKDDDGFGQAEDPVDVEHVKSLYDGEIRFADTFLKKLLEGLDHRGLMDRTLIIITSDHGEEFLDHGSWTHGQSLYNELLRVPLIMVAPRMLPSGIRIPEPVQLIDVAPSILNLLGHRIPEAFEGESLADLIFDRDRERFAHRTVFARASKKPVKMAAIRGRWKCIFTSGKSLELYDLKEDPGEKRDLALVKKDVAADLFSLMQSWMEERKHIDAERQEIEMSERDLERLRTLGYIQ